MLEAENPPKTSAAKRISLLKKIQGRSPEQTTESVRHPELLCHYYIPRFT
jgi:hypothetical protein